MVIGKKFQLSSSRTIAVLAGLLALGGAGYGLTQLLERQPAAVETAPLPQRVEVVALGRIEPQSEVIRVGGPSGERIQQLQVKQGDQVKTGDILAYLESYGERKAERDYAASQLSEAESRLQATTAYGQSQIEEAQTRIQQIAEPGLAEVAAQQANIRELEADLELETQDLQRFEELYSQGVLAKQELDQQVSASRQAQEKLNSARANLTRIQTRQQSEVRTAEAQLQAERANLPLSQTQVTAASARQNLQLAQAKLDRTVIRAPSDGRILNIIAKAGEAIGAEGILDLGDTRQMVAVAEVYETDVGRVKLGQKASIASRNGAFDQPLTGQVSEIGWQIFKNNVLDDDPAANADSRVVEVKVRLDDGQAVEALTNLQVDVRIEIES